ncbi:MAG TPA: filamentous hemagglutinin N-terminal domain-containing protein [Xanthobacteraceae bacterium]|nr:filamentous hemagglutinin N-terminal domain-containing protein [Xanthobacteraceae bacterium]
MRTGTEQGGRAAVHNRVRALLRGTTALTVCGLSAFPAAAQSLPTGGTVVSGSASISQPTGTKVQVNQSSNKAIVNWSGFSIGAGNGVHFDNGSGATLNRVTGPSVSAIDGSLTATGSVYLLNPNGVIVGQTGVVDVGGSFVASTLDVSNGNFLAGGDVTFAGGSDKAVINLGKVGALGGDVALIAARVENAGTVSAPNGTAGLVAGTDVVMRDAAHADGKFLVKAGGAGTQVTNTGAVSAAAAELRANGGNVYALAGNSGGVIRATGVAKTEGRVFLTAPGGEVRVGGTIAASKAPVAGATAKPDGGRIAVSGAKVKVTGTLDASGTKGGQVDVTGTQVALTGAKLKAAGTAGGGLVRVGGDFQGGAGKAGDPLHTAAVGGFADRGTLASAQTVAVDAGSTIDVSASAGNAGTAIVWAEGTTAFAGTILATGGTGAAGGFAEVSGKGVLDYTGLAVLTAAGGTTGTLLLDPYDIVISNATGSNGTLSGGAFTPTGTSVLNAGTLQTALASGNVVVSTGAAGSPGTDAGDITVAANIAWSSANNLTLSAYRNITVNDGVGISNTGAGAMALRADNSGTGVGTVNLLGSSGARLTDSGGGGVEIFYNPLGGFGGANASTITGNPYAARVAVSGPSTFSAYMLVNDVAGLQSINDSATALSGVYALGRNIDATATAGWNAGSGFVPLGTDGAGGVLNGGSGFTGTFDGEGRSINGLTIARPNASNVGLFGYTRNATIRDIGVTNVSIKGFDSVGGLVGTQYAAAGTATVSNAYATGTVSGRDNVGGLVGYKYGDGVGAVTSVTGSSAGATVTGRDLIGGLIGYDRIAYGTSTVARSFATGQVSATGQAVGGLVGYTDNSVYTPNAQPNAQGVAKITDSYATGAVSGKLYVGGLVGFLYGSGVGALASIERSYATGNATGQTYVGGLVGVSYSDYGATAKIDSSWATGSATGGGAVGGLVGANYADFYPGYQGLAIISQSYASGAVKGTSHVGGLVGENYSANSGIATVTQSYATGSVAGASFVGGLVGYNFVAAKGSANISQSYATGAVTGTSYVGGLAGVNLRGNGTAKIENSYWDVGTTGQALGVAGSNGTVTNLVGIGGATGLDPFAASTYANLGSFDTVWYMVDGETRPFLRSEYSTTITNAHQLQLVNMNLGASYKLGADIDMAELTRASGMWRTAARPDALGGYGFVPLGTNGAGVTLNGTGFTGSFDGEGRTIKGLTVVRANVDGVGLFGRAGDAMIEDVYLTNVDLSGRSYVGGLVGAFTAQTAGRTARIADVSVSGSVKGSGDYVGGVAGFSGAIAKAAVATVVNSASTGTVSGRDAVGGLVGISYTEKSGIASVSQSYSTAATSGRAMVGGLVGFTSGSKNTITQSYAAGAVTGQSKVGGLVGQNASVVSASYWDTQATGRSCAGGGTCVIAGTTGLTTAQLQDPAYFVPVASAAGWNFSTVWTAPASGFYPGLVALIP